MTDRICPLKAAAKPHTSTSRCDEDKCMWYVRHKEQCVVRMFYHEAVCKGWKDK